MKVDILNVTKHFSFFFLISQVLLHFVVLVEVKSDSTLPDASSVEGPGYDKEVILNFMGGGEATAGLFSIPAQLNRRRNKYPTGIAPLINRIDIRSPAELENPESDPSSLLRALSLTSHSRITLTGHGLPGADFIQAHEGGAQYTADSIAGFVAKNAPSVLGAGSESQKKLKVSIISCSGGLDEFDPVGNCHKPNTSFASRISDQLAHYQVPSSVSSRTGLTGTTADGKHISVTAHSSPEDWNKNSRYSVQEKGCEAQRNGNCC